MKKIILVAFAALFAAGCVQQQPSESAALIRQLLANVNAMNESITGLSQRIDSIESRIASDDTAAEMNNLQESITEILDSGNVSSLAQYFAPSVIHAYEESEYTKRITRDEAVELLQGIIDETRYNFDQNNEINKIIAEDYAKNYRVFDWVVSGFFGYNGPTLEGLSNSRKLVLGINGATITAIKQGGLESVMYYLQDL